VEAIAGWLMLRLIYAIRAALSSPITPYLRSHAKRRQQRLGEGDLAISAAVEPDVEGHQAGRARGQRKMVEARFPYWK